MAAQSAHLLPRPAYLLPKTATDDQLSQYLIAITVRACDAGNERNWNTDSDPWIHFTRVCASEWSPDQSQYKRTDICNEEADHLPETGHSLVDYIRKLVTLAPGYEARTLSMTTTNIDRGIKHATVIWHVERSGIPTGVTRTSVCMLNFQEVATGFWQCIRVRDLPGMDFI